MHVIVTFQDILSYLQQNSWFIFLTLMIAANSFMLLKIHKQQQKIIPKGRLIHFIYQSIATTDVQVGQLIQKVTDLQQQQEEMLLKLTQWREAQQQTVRNQPARSFGVKNDMAYVNAIKDLQSGKSLDEIAIHYQLSRDELEILAAVYAPKIGQENSHSRKILIKNEA